MSPRDLPLLGLSLLAAIAGRAQSADTVFVEAESLASQGGWKLDTSFTNIVGSPYLLAHGLGKPVADATGTVRIPAAGEYRVWVRTKDWVAHWNAPGTPGRFQLIVNGQPVAAEFGTKGAEWHWQEGGKVTLPAGDVKIALHDLTGFAGRADAILFSKDAAFVPPEGEALVAARSQWNSPKGAEDQGEFDLVVVGGGYGGLGAALSASRQSLKVAFIQDRFVLGGNGSSEIGVWAMGGTTRGKYPHLGEIIEEIGDRSPDSPGRVDSFGDELKEKVVRKEKNISLFLGHFATGVTMDGNRIAAVKAIDVKTGREKVFRAKFVADTTGHGWVGAYAGATFRTEPNKRMGMSNMWFYQDEAQASTWPATPWALPLEMGDFPLLQKSKSKLDDKPFMKAEWFWESGFDKDPIKDLEYIRDWNFRAMYGAFSALKNGAQKEKYAFAELKWASHVGGPRESRLFDGDIILNKDNIVQRTDFPDGCVPTTWDIDLHYAKEQYAKKFPDNPFISRAAFGYVDASGKHIAAVDRRNGYPLPYRLFYSKNISNLFFAGRHISVTHEALGTVRVMRTIGMMGEVVGKAAYLAVRENTDPRGVYEKHLPDLIKLMEQPGRMRRSDLRSDLFLDTSIADFKELPVGRMNADLHKSAPSKLSADELQELAKLGGLVVDDSQAKLEGKWTAGHGIGHLGAGYHFASGAGNRATYVFEVKAAGKYELRGYWEGHENRAGNSLLTINRAGEKPVALRLNQKVGAIETANVLGKFTFAAGTHTLVLSTDGAKGNVHADAFQLVLAE
ncbi:MAG: hypothetical protein RL639_210 [Verrucomicrobiota bacterium]|jgi:hypothetical protein